ncbi:AsmA family protein [Hyphomonas neptunium ATCC 15444]|uniref:AsmA family protein n=2 Tax=Hyphomonas TaxID=85 RepID=Q0BY26_HYPNA|nr:AsmA-like C-terminal region-containing protein [Hyphomonas neptunium]ABI76656.1 AsmA family protein [Hyphomonas neptunium ATCC 15444]
MTFPAFGTPVTNWALGIWGPDGASVSRAHTRFPGVTTLDFQNFEAPEKVEIEGGTIRANLFGFIPGVSWVSRADAERGYIALAPGGDESGDFSLRKLRALIDEVSIRDIDVRYTRNDLTNVIAIKTASGSLRSGALNIDASGGGSTLQFEGSAEASTLSSLSGRLRLAGDNFADFAWLAGFAAPDTPPYDAVADIRIGGDLWTFDFRPETRIGDSDLAGPLNIQFGGGTPIIDADLRSANLDFDDLGIVFGVPIGVGADETVGEEQERARRILDESPRLIPNAVIDFTRLDAVDGTVTFEANQVSDAIFDIRGLKLEIEIEGRVVRAPVLEVRFAEGQLSSYVTLDGSQSPAMTTAEGKLIGVPFANLAADPYVKGTVFGEFKLDARGDGFREAAGSLDGRLSTWSQDADLLAIVAEGAALDVGEILLLLNERAGEEVYTPGQCAAISVAFTDGIGAMDPALIDTEDSLVLLNGEIDLKQETLDLRVQSEAKDASFGTLVGDLTISGTFRSPRLSVLNPEIALQIGIAAALASVTGGLAALPFIELGDTPDAPCADILARAETTRE